MKSKGLILITGGAGYIGSHVNKELKDRGLRDKSISRLGPVMTLSGDNKTKLEKLETMLSSSEEGIRGIEETKKLLKLKKAVKIKILRNSPIEDIKSFFEEFENIIGFKLYRVKGNTGIFIFKKINR